MKIAGFEWDDGNWPKCGKHGVTREEIDDPHPNEPRMRAIGTTTAGRFVFLVFMLRKLDRKTLVRPISARYMHQKEIDHYESKT
jgi:uncharacterized DUF497 family protein